MAPPQTRTRPQLSEVRDHEVIDLTSDDYGPALPTNAPLGNASRGPRFGHNIIDITEESSPEVQFLSSRRLPVPQHQTSQTLTPRSPTQIEMDVEMELEITGSAPVPQTNNSINNSGPMSADYRSRFDNFALRVLSRAAGAGNARLVAAAAAMDFIAPILDFQTVGFEMGMHREETASPVSIYQAPPAPPEGFTRSAEEGDVLVCPNCGDELCSGEAESKKQVWIVKGCGHVRDSVLLLVALYANTNL
jgi:hypothetical protein